MLIRFSVTGYRGFDKPIEIDFTDKKNYQFGKECVRGDFLDKVVIVGANGVGKTNFGYALLDIVATIAGFNRDIGQCNEVCFVNGNSSAKNATFHYEFANKGDYIVYEYSKDSPEHVISEKLSIGRTTIFEYTLSDMEHGVFNLPLVNASKIDISTLDGSKALLRRIIEETYQDKYSTIRALSDFTNHSLYYMAMWKKDEHIGIIDHEDDPEQFIIDEGYIDEFEAFLKEVGANEIRLSSHNGKLFIETGNKDLPFNMAASRGTRILCRLFCWIKRCVDRDSILFFDDFDDMFHYKPAENAMRQIIASTRGQCIFVTHNTGLISNDFLRPDCCFIMENGSLDSLASRTAKDIRRGHNLEKMLRDGEFDKSN